MESIQHFFDRCEAWLGDIVPSYTTDQHELLGGQIIARRGQLCLVSSGYPEETEDGPVYQEVVLVDIAGELDVVVTDLGPVATERSVGGRSLRVQV